MNSDQMRTHLCRGFTGLLLSLLCACSTAPQTHLSPQGKASGPHPLQASSWQLHEADGQIVEAEKFSKKPYMVFRPVNNRVEGFGGCNGFFTTYTGQGEELKFGDVASSRMACREIGKIEKLFFKALEETTRYELVGEYLLLYNGDDLLARLRPRVKE